MTGVTVKRGAPSREFIIDIPEFIIDIPEFPSVPYSMTSRFVTLSPNDAVPFNKKTQSISLSGFKGSPRCNRIAALPTIHVKPMSPTRYCVLNTAAIIRGFMLIPLLYAVLIILF